MLDLYTNVCFYQYGHSGLQTSGLPVLSCTAPFLYYFVLYRFCVVLYCVNDHCCQLLLLEALLVFLNICHSPDKLISMTILNLRALLQSRHGLPLHTPVLP